MPSLEINNEGITIDGGLISVDSSDFYIRCGRSNSIISTVTPDDKYKYIMSYNYSPKSFNFHRVYNEEDIYLGVEIEIDKAGKNDDNAKLSIDIMGDKNVYCKHDGSLSSGFEIVTHPCTYEYHQELPYKTLFKKLSELGYRAHDTTTCGLHIHVNRDYFSKDKLIQDLCISKLLYLFEKFWDEITVIARRNSNAYAQRYHLKKDETILDMYAKSKNGGKYGVINLSHKDTCEIRIFKGTLNYKTYMCTLEFVKTFIKIVKDIDIYKIQEVTWEDIYNKFSDDLKEYILDRKNKNNNEPTSSSNYFSLDSFTLSNEQVSSFRIEYESAFLENPNISEMTMVQVKDKMKEIKRLIRRTRNIMEEQNLRRELDTYSRRLAELRRNS